MALATFFWTKEAASETREEEERADKGMEHLLSTWLLKKSSKYVVQPLSSEERASLEEGGALVMELIEDVMAFSFQKAKKLKMRRCS